MYNFDLGPLCIWALIGLTLGTWKIVEIIIWLFKHVSITIH
jgi:hypothetical protein